MIRRIGWVFLTVCCISAAARAEVRGEAAEADAGKTLALVAVGGVDEAMVRRVRDFAERNLAIPVRLAPSKAESGTALHDIGVALAGALEPDDIAMVVLASPASDVKDHAVYLYDRNTAVVNADALKPEPEDAETYGRRLEKLVMRSYALLLGIKVVPNPQSALFPYKNLDELDAIGRGIDPPTLRQVQEAAEKLGVKPVKGSPFAW